MPATKKQINSRLRKVAREVASDIRKMENIQALIHFLNHRDTNCGSAASLTDAIEVLINEALRLHRAELKEWVRMARTGKIR